MAMLFLWVVSRPLSLLVKAQSYLISVFLRSDLSKDANVGWNILRLSVRTVHCHRGESSKRKQEGSPTN